MAKELLKIRPYARLLSMIGEQLIKNERIALTELIKNSYDADAGWVKVNFVTQNKECPTNGSDKLKVEKIVIEDNGLGMSLDTIRRAWMNPATPNKKGENGEVVLSPKGRVVQGEKGIGRFAIFKLGSKAVITTKESKTNVEYTVNFDLSVYRDELTSDRGEKKEIFLDDIAIEVVAHKPEIFNKRDVHLCGRKFKDNEHGTIIEISHTKGEWTKNKITKLYNDIGSLEPIFDSLFSENKRSSFCVAFFINGKETETSSDVKKSREVLANALENKAVFKITKGWYNETKQCFSFELNGNSHLEMISKQSTLDTEYKSVENHVNGDTSLASLKFFRDRFQDKETKNYRKSECGDFNFCFYIFDFAADRNSKNYLDKQDKELIKRNRIFLYRDGIRVMPYGDPDDDWLEIDKRRGIGRAGDYLSNDQVVGYIEISKKGNPLLRDKTNREGLIEDGDATGDFICLIQSFLSIIRLNFYKKYLIDKKNKKKALKSISLEIGNKIAELQQKIKDKDLKKKFDSLGNLYRKEREFFDKKITMLEDLAGVGLSVETASHDLMMMLSRSLENLHYVYKFAKARKVLSGVDKKKLTDDVLDTINGLDFVKDQMQNIQLLFTSSKQRKKNIELVERIKKVKRIFDRVMEYEGIQFTIVKKGPFFVECTDAVLLETFINLIDNSIYWLSAESHPSEKKIQITIDEPNKKVIFSDNGLGITAQNEPYVFEAFYSTKEEGRGLGLYIAKNLLNRMGYSIRLANQKNEQILSGANFVIVFGDQE